MCHCLSREAPTRGLSLITFTLAYELCGLGEEETKVMEERLKRE